MRVPATVGSAGLFLLVDIADAVPGERPGEPSRTMMAPRISSYTSGAFGNILAIFRIQALQSAAEAQPDPYITARHAKRCPLAVA
jgi:hypothetical protein